MESQIDTSQSKKRTTKLTLCCRNQVSPDINCIQGAEMTAHDSSLEKLIQAMQKAKCDEVKKKTLTIFLKGLFEPEDIDDEDRNEFLAKITRVETSLQKLDYKNITNDALAKSILEALREFNLADEVTILPLIIKFDQLELAYLSGDLLKTTSNNGKKVKIWSYLEKDKAVYSLSGRCLSDVFEAIDYPNPSKLALNLIGSYEFKDEQGENPIFYIREFLTQLIRFTTKEEVYTYVYDNELAKICETELRSITLPRSQHDPAVFQVVLKEDNESKDDMLLKQPKLQNYIISDSESITTINQKDWIECTILCNGSEQCWKEFEQCVKHKRPLIILKGSGGFSNILLKYLELKRSLNNEATLRNFLQKYVTDSEIQTFLMKLETDHMAFDILDIRQATNQDILAQSILKALQKSSIEKLTLSKLGIQLNQLELLAQSGNLLEILDDKNEESRLSLVKKSFQLERHNFLKYMLEKRPDLTEIIREEFITEAYPQAVQSSENTNGLKKGKGCLIKKPNQEDKLIKRIKKHCLSKQDKDFKDYCLISCIFTYKGLKGQLTEQDFKNRNLFILCILTKKFKLAKLFWRYVKYPIGGALYACMVLGEMINEDKDEELKRLELKQNKICVCPPRVKAIIMVLLCIVFSVVDAVLLTMFFEASTYNPLEWVAWVLIVCFVSEWGYQIEKGNRFTILQLCTLISFFLGYFFKVGAYYSSTDEKQTGLMQTSKIVLAINYPLFCCCFLEFYYLFEFFGPLLTTIWKMISTLIKFGVIIAVFYVAFVVSIEVVLNPTPKATGERFFEMFSRFFWAIYGDYGFDMLENTNEVQTYTESGIYFVKITTGAYAVLINTLLISLLIAVFGNDLMLVEERTNIWRFERLKFTRKYDQMPFLFPKILAKIFKCSKSENDEDHIFAKEILDDYNLKDMDIIEREGQQKTLQSLSYFINEMHITNKIQGNGDRVRNISNYNTSQIQSMENKTNHIMMLLEQQFSRPRRLSQAYSTDLKYLCNHQCDQIHILPPEGHKSEYTETDEGDKIIKFPKIPVPVYDTFTLEENQSTSDGPTERHSETLTNAEFNSVRDAQEKVWTSRSTQVQEDLRSKDLRETGTNTELAPTRVWTSRSTQAQEDLPSKDLRETETNTDNDPTREPRVVYKLTDTQIRSYRYHPETVPVYDTFTLENNQSTSDGPTERHSETLTNAEFNSVRDAQEKVWTSRSTQVQEDLPSKDLRETETNTANDPTRVWTSRSTQVQEDLRSKDLRETGTNTELAPTRVWTSRSTQAQEDLPSKDLRETETNTDNDPTREPRVVYKLTDTQIRSYRYYPETERKVNKIISDWYSEKDSTHKRRRKNKRYFAVRTKSRLGVRWKIMAVQKSYEEDEVLNSALPRNKKS